MFGAKEKRGVILKWRPIFYNRYRMVKMLREALIDKHPLGVLGYGKGDILSSGEMGAVMSRRGVGKTALLVQIALNAMLQGKNVLHVSLKEPVDKVVLWYKELFSHLVGSERREETRLLFEDILPHRFILTFKIEGLTIPRLEERINDLVEQGIFHPELLIIDGLNFDENTRKTVEEMKQFAGKRGLGVWFSVPIHRHLEDGRKGMPLPVAGLEHLFTVILLLTSEEGGIRIKPLLSPPAVKEKVLLLDPSSLLVAESATK